MTNSYGPTECVSGYVTNISNENKKKKYFIKFTLLAENSQIIDGWVFNSRAGILQSKLGIALSSSLKNKTAIKVWGTLERNNGKCKTFC
jgi:hypothetical protein